MSEKQLYLVRRDHNEDGSGFEYPWQPLDPSGKWLTREDVENVLLGFTGIRQTISILDELFGDKK